LKTMGSWSTSCQIFTPASAIRLDGLRWRCLLWKIRAPFLLQENPIKKGSAPHLQAKLLCPGQTDRFPPTAEEEVLTDAKVPKDFSSLIRVVQGEKSHNQPPTCWVELTISLGGRIVGMGRQAATLLAPDQGLVVEVRLDQRGGAPVSHLVYASPHHPTLRSLSLVSAKQISSPTTTPTTTTTTTTINTTTTKKTSMEPPDILPLPACLLAELGHLPTNLKAPNINHLDHPLYNGLSSPGGIIIDI